MGSFATAAVGTVAFEAATFGQHRATIPYCDTRIPQCGTVTPVRDEERAVADWTTPWITTRRAPTRKDGAIPTPDAGPCQQVIQHIGILKQALYFEVRCQAIFLIWADLIRCGESSADLVPATCATNKCSALTIP